MNFITEPAKKIPVCYEADVCVVGGGTCGVAAAVRAAKLGAKVVIIEKSNRFGGVATTGLVNIWHSFYDIDQKEQIIAGFSEEVMAPMLKEGTAVYFPQNKNFVFNPEELTVVLDKIVLQNNIKVYFHTYYAGLLCEDAHIQAVIVENKDGRSAIKAKFFIDATGDGDLARDLGLESYVNEGIQPSSACFFMQGDVSYADFAELIGAHGEEFELDNDWGWDCWIPQLENIAMRADSHIKGLMCNKADDLTQAEFIGRRQTSGFQKLMRKYQNPECALVNTCSEIGIRETVHYRTKFQANEYELLTGKRYEDAIVQGTYNIDIHHPDGVGITFKHLTGEMEIYHGKDCKPILRNWRDEMDNPPPIAKFYQAPFAMLVQEKIANFIPVGRMINADNGAFGALRVMVNLNQMGEAAGVAAVDAIDQGIAIQQISGVKVREMLKKGGSAL